MKNSNTNSVTKKPVNKPTRKPITNKNNTNTNKPFYKNKSTNTNTSAKSNNVKTTKSTSKANSKLKVFALGGLGEVGKNMYVLEYEDDIVVIDSGIMFPDDSLLGIDYVIPDYQYLIQNQDRIRGLFITHAHEDHIGGIPFLLKQVKINQIYAGKLAIGLIKKKLEEHKLTNATTFVPVNESKKIVVGDHFKFSFIRTNHSIPNTYAFAIETPVGNVLHTGDFKFDFTPIGEETEFHKLANFGRKKPLLLLSDSTNSQQPGFTKSERTVSSSIKSIFNRIKGRIIVATFASNIHRVQQIVEASLEANRKVAVFGRSMDNAINVGTELKYIKVPKDTFVRPSQLKRLNENEVTIICTGSQGEPLAALSRIANGTHKQISIIPGDTVIFSSSPIPGNAASVNNTINQLYRAGANVITNSAFTDTHTSGHATQEELKMMLQLIKPKFFMPMHGEYHMLKQHTKLAMQCGMKEENCFVLDNGQVLSLDANSAEITGKVPSGITYIDGNSIGDIGTVVIKERRTLSDDGAVFYNAVVSTKTNNLVLNSQIKTKGLIIKDENSFLTTLKQKIDAHLIKELQNLGENGFNDSINQKIVWFITDYFYKRISCRPMVTPIILTTDQ